MEENTLKRGYTLKIYPNKRQEAYFLISFDASRKIWNEVLRMQKKRHENNPNLKFLGKYKTSILVTQYKKEHPWLFNTDASAVQNPCMKLDIAWKNFFKDKSHKKHGKPHRKNYATSKKSFGGAVVFSKQGVGNARVLDKYHVILPKIGAVRTADTHMVKNMQVKNYAVTLRPDGTYILSLQGNIPTKTALPKTGKVVGIDVGLKDLLITSDGIKKAYLDVSDLENKAKYYQRKYSKEFYLAKSRVERDKNAGHNTDSPLLPPRRVTDFKNWQRNKAKYARVWQKIVNKRKYYYDCLTRWLVETYDIIVIEDLKVSNMMKNHHLAHAIAGANWYKFRAMLAYKCEESGKQLIVVNPKNTSRICSECGKKNKQFDNLSQAEWLAVREWNCPYCQAHHDRDVNAAKNILKSGLKKTSSQSK